MAGERSADSVRGAPIRFAGGSANMSLVPGGGWWAVDDGRNAHTDVIEVVIEVVNEGSGRSFFSLEFLSPFFNAGLVTLVRSLLV